MPEEYKREKSQQLQFHLHDISLLTDIASRGRPFPCFPLYVQVLRASTVEYYDRMSVVRHRIAAS
ncbi:hypothetical protein E2C01_045031 [Portunus trituberculatus]|uniref:Uncharacterized protein n=1 Tax=Portunus trituberculatus TaxID=210409 RepID=A0A5B7FTN5_PORTR|nr:hypothetical protein [Portunus trituberculatus]